MIPPLNRRFVVIAGLILLFEWTWVLLGSPSQKDILASLPSLHANVSEDIFDYDPVESNAIKDICAATEWDDDLIFTCENSAGGMADIRNSILTCLRFTIAAGARLVLPRIILPNASGASESDAVERADLDYMFDQQHFLKSLHLSCPQLRIFQELDSIPDLAGMHDPLYLQPEDLQSPLPATGIPHPETWRADFRIWLDSQTATRVPVRGTSIINLARSPPIYPISIDGLSFSRDFGALLKTRSDARRLATTIFHRLIEVFYLDATDSTAIAENAYLGAYLSTEGAVEHSTVEDPIHSHTILTQHILNQTLSSNLSVLYLTTTSPSTNTHISSHTKPLGIHVVDKFSLLPALDSTALHALAPEQQELVDFLVLSKASQFTGVGGSVFVWSVALRRGGTWRTKDGRVEGELMRDSLSWIYREEWAGDDGFAGCVWP